MSPRSKKLKARLLETAAPSRPHSGLSATTPSRVKVPTKVAIKETAPPTAISDDASAALARQWRRARPPKTAPPEDDDDGGIVDAMSIRLFCKRHGISPSFFHYLVKVGKGPRTIKLGARTLITIEAAADWRHEREAATVAATRADAAG